MQDVIIGAIWIKGIWDLSVLFLTNACKSKIKKFNKAKLWSIDQQHQHPLAACLKCRNLGHPLDLLTWKLPFTKSSGNWCVHKILRSNALHYTKHFGNKSPWYLVGLCFCSLFILQIKFFMIDKYTFYKMKQIISSNLSILYIEVCFFSKSFDFLIYHSLTLPQEILVILLVILLVLLRDAF